MIALIVHMFDSKASHGGTVLSNVAGCDGSLQLGVASFSWFYKAS